jgi:hypothetical protein
LSINNDHLILNLKFYLFLMIFCFSSSWAANKEDSISKEVAPNYVVSGLFGGVICEENDLIYEKPIIFPCTVKTGKNSFLELKSNNGASIIVGSNTNLLLKASSFELKGGSFRIMGELPVNISGYGYQLKRETGDQLFFSSQVFQELELLSIESDIVFFETHEINEKKKYSNTKIPAGSWANIGGRFGKTLGDFYELSKDQMDYFKGFLLPQSSSSKRRE